MRISGGGGTRCAGDLHPRLRNPPDALASCFCLFFALRLKNSELLGVSRVGVSGPRLAKLGRDLNATCVHLPHRSTTHWTISTMQAQCARTEQSQVIHDEYRAVSLLMLSPGSPNCSTKSTIHSNSSSRWLRMYHISQVNHGT